jgi:hypothetical protein
VQSTPTEKSSGKNPYRKLTDDYCDLDATQQQYWSDGGSGKHLIYSSKTQKPKKSKEQQPPASKESKESTLVLELPAQRGGTEKRCDFLF